MVFGEEFRRVFMPYCLVRMEKNKNSWIVLNREYKPLGQPLNVWADYDKYPWYAIKGMTEEFAKKISFDLKAHKAHWPEVVYLYNDGCIPTRSKKAMDDYQRRLGLLMKKETFKLGG